MEISLARQSALLQREIGAARRVPRTPPRDRQEGRRRSAALRIAPAGQRVTLRLL